MTALFITSLIISTVLAVDQAVGMSLANNRSASITKKASELTKAITQDQSLMAQLQEAYNKRDVMLMNQLINTSPFGTRYYNLRNEYKSNVEKQKALAQAQTDAQTEAAKVQGQVSDAQAKSQTSGSAIADLISGSAFVNPTGVDDYKGSGITQKQISEVNYGQK